MKTLAKYALAAFVAGGTAIAVSAPASAEIGLSIGVGRPYVADYDYYRPCSYYRYWRLPAPARCYNDFYGYYGSDVFINSGFVFRDRDDFGRWRDRDDFHHWRDHDDHRGHDWDRDRHDHDRDRDSHHDHDRWR